MRYKDLIKSKVFPANDQGIKKSIKRFPYKVSVLPENAYIAKMKYYFVKNGQELPESFIHNYAMPFKEEDDVDDIFKMASDESYSANRDVVLLVYEVFSANLSYLSFCERSNEDVHELIMEYLSDNEKRHTFLHEAEHNSPRVMETLSIDDSIVVETVIQHVLFEFNLNLTEVESLGLLDLSGIDFLRT